MKQFFSSFFVLLFLLWFGCSDDPNSVGLGLIPKQDSLSLKTFDTTASTVSQYMARIAGVSGRQLFGKSNGIETRAIMQFAGIPNGLTSFVLDTAFLRVRVAYRFKDSSGIFSLDVRRMLRSWVKDSLRWDSTNVASLVSSTADTSFVRSVTAQDSIIEIPVAPVVRSWMQESLSSPYGMMFAPRFDCNVILGSSTYYDILVDLRPELYVVYRQDTTTYRYSLSPFQQLFVADAPLPVTSDPVFFLESGIAHRGKLRFDLSSLPRKASITRAFLTLTLDSTHTLRNSFSSNTIVAHLAGNSDSIPSLSTLTASGTIGTTNTVTIDVKTLIQQVVTKNQNNGIVLRPSGEFVAVERYAFFSQAASDSAKRPHLKISYTILP